MMLEPRRHDADISNKLKKRYVALMHTGHYFRPSAMREDALLKIQGILGDFISAWKSYILKFTLSRLRYRQETALLARLPEAARI